MSLYSTSGNRRDTLQNLQDKYRIEILIQQIDALIIDDNMDLDFVEGQIGNYFKQKRGVLRLGSKWLNLLSCQEWFIAILFKYLKFRDIVRLDSSLLNHGVRPFWLKHLKKNVAVNTNRNEISSDYKRVSKLKWSIRRKLSFHTLALDDSCGRTIFTPDGTGGLRKMGIGLMLRCQGLISIGMYGVTMLNDECLRIFLSNTPLIKCIVLQDCRELTHNCLYFLGRYSPDLESITITNSFRVVGKMNDSNHNHNHNNSNSNSNYISAEQQHQQSCSHLLKNCHQLKSFSFHYEGNVMTAREVGDVSSNRFNNNSSSNNNNNSHSSLAYINDISFPNLQVSVNSNDDDDHDDSSDGEEDFILPAHGMLSLDPLIPALSYNCPVLESLQLSYYNTGEIFSVALITTKMVSSLAKKCTQLKKIKIRGTTCMSHALYTQLGKYCHQFEDLHVFSSCYSGGGGIGVDLESAVVFEAVGEEYGMITDADLQSIASGCCQLHSFELNSCNLLTDVGYIALAQHCASLTSLTCADSRITDLSLTALGQHSLQSLKRIELEGCHLITDEGVACLLGKYNNNNNNNRNNSSSNTNKATSSTTAVAVTVTVGSQLERISIRNCRRLTRWSIDSIHNKCRHLQILHCSENFTRFVRELESRRVKVIYRPMHW